jgi:biopolymer transport protein ExbB
MVVAGSLSYTWSAGLLPGVAYAQEGGGDAPEERTLIDNVKSGGPIGFVIFCCSVVGVSLAITFAFQIRRDVLVPPDLLGQVEELFEDEDYDEALSVCESDPAFLATVLSAGLARTDEGYEEMQSAMAETGELEATKLHQKVGYLQLIAAVAPMLGLLGTVSGMIATFTKIATSPVQPKPADLADGISQALVTTFMGLTLAIPLTVVYAVFRNRVVNGVSEVAGITDELTTRFKTK